MADSGHHCFAYLLLLVFVNSSHSPLEIKIGGIVKRISKRKQVVRIAFEPRRRGRGLRAVSTIPGGQTICDDW